MQNIITYNRINQNDLQIFIEYRIKFAVEFSGQRSLESINQLKESNENYFEKAINNNSFIAYIAKQGNDIAGIGGMVIREQPASFKNLSGKVGYLMLMYTIPSFRRKGICTGILKALINDAMQMGIIAFELHATKEGEFVYKQNGFELHNEPTYRKYIK
jgi:predicted acetyltransferase